MVAFTVAFNHAELDDSMSARMILSGIQPEDEAYLQSQLALMSKVEIKGLKEGRIPIDDTYYLMGTTDPTGTLKQDQVCIILYGSNITISLELNGHLCLSGPLVLLRHSNFRKNNLCETNLSLLGSICIFYNLFY